jgi:hypothetical protein
VSSIIAIDYKDDVYVHEWQVGNLAAWSNRLLIHTATSTRRGEGKTAHKDTMSHDKDALMAWKGAGSMSSGRNGNYNLKKKVQLSGGFINTSRKKVESSGRQWECLGGFHELVCFGGFIITT